VTTSKKRFLAEDTLFDRLVEKERQTQTLNRWVMPLLHLTSGQLRLQKVERDSWKPWHE